MHIRAIAHCRNEFEFLPTNSCLRDYASALFMRLRIYRTNKSSFVELYERILDLLGLAAINEVFIKWETVDIAMTDIK